MNELQSTPLTNYLIPAIGNIAGVPLNIVLSASPANIDFSSVSLNGVPFQPQAVLIDNSAGIGPAALYSQALGLNLIIVQAGQIVPVNFPAYGGDVYTMTGNGACSMVWMNAPLLGVPSAYSVAVTNAPTVQANIINALVATVPRPVIGSYAAGLIIAVGQTSASSSINLANLGDLVKVNFAVSGGATLAVASEVNLQLQVNNNTFYSENIYIPSVASGRSIFRDLDFNVAAFAGAIVGSGAFCKVLLSAPLTAGTVSANFYLN